MDPSTFENNLKCTSPERNRLQNCFLDPEFQKLVIKKFVNIEQELPSVDINRFYKTEFYQKCMGAKQFTLETNIGIEFNPGTFWDVYMVQEYTGHVMECSFAAINMEYVDMEAVNYYKQTLNEILKSKTIEIYSYNRNGPVLGFKINYLDKTFVVRCLIIPLLGDEYPFVLRAMKMKSDEDENGDCSDAIVLLVEHFSAAYTSKEQLIQIFKYSSIDVLFYNDLIGYNSVQET